MDGNGWEWMGMDGNGWDWMGMDGNGWEWCVLDVLAIKVDNAFNDFGRCWGWFIIVLPT